MKLERHMLHLLTTKTRYEELSNAHLRKLITCAILAVNTKGNENA